MSMLPSFGVVLINFEEVRFIKVGIPTKLHYARVTYQDRALLLRIGRGPGEIVGESCLNLKSRLWNNFPGRSSSGQRDSGIESQDKWHGLGGVIFYECNFLKSTQNKTNFRELVLLQTLSRI